MPDPTSPRPHLMLRTLARQLGRDLSDAEHRDAIRGLLGVIRAGSGIDEDAMDEFWLTTLARQQAAVREAADQQTAVRELLATMTRPPLRIGTFLGSAAHDDGPTARVRHEGSTLLVGLADGVDPRALGVGDEVVLNSDRNLLLGSSPYPADRCGETVSFSRRLDRDPDRLVIERRDEEVIVRAGARLDLDALREGDRLLWDAETRIALEKVERSNGSAMFLEETPDETFEDVGGLDEQVASLKESVRLRRDFPELAERYRLRPVGSALLVGPPGTGKTLLARAFANWLAAESPAGRSRFMNIKPSALHSPWYAQSEANYREAFRVARMVGAAEPSVPVVMFFDEIDSVGAARSALGQRVDDRVLTALMAELDGLESRGNILVIAATNRRDALDPALLRPGRLGDLVLEVPRPDRAAAVRILEKHLPPDIPYAASDAMDPRHEMIEVTISRMFAPNADDGLATLTLRDGTRRTVASSDLVSGAILENIARGAVERACAREARGGAAGVSTHDLLDVASAELETAARALRPGNATRFLSGLPDDVDVVRVESIDSRPRRIHRYLEVA